MNLSDAITQYKILYPKVKIRNKSTALSISLDDEASCFEQLANLLLPNGVISGLGFALDISNNLIVQPGVWQIDRVQYAIGTISTFALDAQDPTLSRYDIIYADTINQLHILSGALSSTPVIPAIPNNTLLIATALITPTVVTLGTPFPTDYVDTLTNQNHIDGIKTFLKSPQVPNAVNGQDAVAFNQLSTILNASFANGVTTLGSNVFGLGGLLNHNTTITGGVYALNLDGHVTVTATPLNPTDVLRLSDVVLADGVINGCTLSISGTTATIQPGRWRISNIIYQSTTPTILTLDPQDATLSRFDVIYADGANTFHVISGVLSSSPGIPLIPAGTLEIAEILITPTSVTTTPTPPITNYVTTTTPQSGIAGNKSWDGIQYFNTDVHLNGAIYASNIPYGDVFSNVAGGDIILQGGRLYVTQPYRYNYIVPFGSNVGDYNQFANIVNFDSFNNARMTVIVANNMPGNGSNNTTTAEFEFILDYHIDSTKWYIISPIRRDGGPNTIDYTLEIQRSTNVDIVGIAYSYQLRIRRTILDVVSPLAMSVWMESSPVYSITRSSVTGNSTTAALNYYSAQISFVGQNIFDSSGNMFAKATGTFMPIAGGSFTGPVSFSADPTTTLGGATKQYVDNKIAATKVYFGSNTFVPGGPTFTDDPGTINNPYIFSDSGITGQLLAGYSSTTGTVTTGDSILSAIGKLNGNQANYVALAGSVMTGFLTLSADPTSASHAATKSYVDNLITGITWKQEVKAATTANITLSGTQTIDGYAAIAGDRILVKNQTTATNNGIYLVASGAWTRTLDANTSSEIGSATVLVRFGTVNIDTQWTCTNSTDPVIGTDNITFGQISGGGTYTNGTGLNLAGNVFSVNPTYIKGLFSATSPIFYDSSTGIISSQAASGSQAGYVSSTDWNTFNNKQPTLNPVAVQTGNYSVLAFNFVPVDTSSGNLTMTLPNAPPDKTQAAIKHVIQGGTNVVTINASGSDVFNKAGGVTTFNLSMLAQGVWLQYRSSTGIWYILSDDLALSQLDLRYSPIAGSASITTLGAIASGSIPYSLVTGGPSNPMTTLGDIIYGGASGVQTRLAGNTTSTQKFLTQTGTGTVSAAPAYFDLFGSANTFTGSQTINQTNLQTASGDALLIGTSTVATSGVPQQFSGALNFFTYGWNTSGTPASHIMNFRIEAEAQTGSQDLAFLSFKGATNGGAYTGLFTLDTSGNFIVPSGSFTLHKGFIAAVSTDGIVLDGVAAATVGNPIQKSTRIRQQASVWNTKATAAANYVGMSYDMSGVSSNAPVGKLAYYGGLSTTTTVTQTEIMDLFHYGALSLIPQAATINAWANSTEASATGAILNIGGATLTDGITAASTTLTYAFGSSISKPTFAATNTGVVYTNAATLHIAAAPAAGTNVTITNGYSLFLDGSIAIAGSTSGVITLQTQAAAGTYNWNYPITAGSAGTVLTSQGGGSTAMSWSSCPIIQASNDLQAQTSAGNITTFTVGASTATFNISAYLNVTAVSTDVIQIQVTYTDENSVSQTVSFSTINSIADSSYNPVIIRAKNATVITVKTNLTVGAGTVTFDAGARIIQL